MTQTDQPTVTAEDLKARVAELLAANDPATMEPLDFLRARFDAGLAWVHFPVGLGGLGIRRQLQSVVDSELQAAGAPDNDPRRIGIGLGMAAPTILTFGTEEQKQRFLRPLWTGEEVWCQLFSEPGAGSDLAALGTRAVRDGDTWVVNGQKVWTSSAHMAQWAILVTRTNPDVPKHQGMTYFICDMTDPGVEVRPLRQITGEAEFNELFFEEARIPDENVLGGVGNGWTVAITTLMHERAGIGAASAIGVKIALRELIDLARERGVADDPIIRQRIAQLQMETEALRLNAWRGLTHQMKNGVPGPEGSLVKWQWGEVNQGLTELATEIRGEEGLLRDSEWTYRFLRARANSIEGGTTEILKNIVAERVLGLPKLR
jgi:alkylation response protein AidB-like acyl-CoA dehydrogenase